MIIRALQAIEEERDGWMGIWGKGGRKGCRSAFGCGSGRVVTWAWVCGYTGSSARGCEGGGGTETGREGAGDAVGGKVMGDRLGGCGKEKEEKI